MNELGYVIAEKMKTSVTGGAYKITRESIVQLEKQNL